VSQEEALQGEPGPDEASLSGAGSPPGGVPSARRRGAVAIGVLEYVAGQIVDDPSAIRVDVEEGRGGVTLRLHVAPDDMGKVIGKRGRVAQSIRTLVRAAGAREGIGVNVAIVD
jgi:predicted RNA-binding protein YlqC (UPF0109 family)